MQGNQVRAAVLLFLLSILPFTPVLRADYLNWDDDLYFTANPDIVTTGGWKNALSRFGQDANVYPVVFFSFLAEHSLFGENPLVSHAINLILHGAAAMLAFLFLARTAPDWRIAFWAALFFAVHPLQTATVAWVSERKSLLGAVFLLTALVVLSGDRTGRRIGWTVPLAIMAYLCKSPLIVFPAVLLATRFLLVSSPQNSDSPSGVEIGWRGFWPMFGVHVAVAAFFGWIYSQREVSQSLSLLERLELVPRSLFHYLAKWVYPVDLVPVYPKWEFLGSGAVAFGWGAVAVVALGVILLRKRMDALEWWGGFFFLATLAPALGFVSFGYQKHSYVSDHFMHLPLLGLSTLLACATTRISIVRGSLLPVLCVAIVALWGAAAWKECEKWRSPEAFWGAVLDADPRSWIARQNLAAHLEGEGETEQAFDHYRLAVEIDPDEPIGWINLGRNLILLGRSEEAVRVLARAIDLNVYYLEAHLLRAEAFLRLGMEKEALDQFHSAIAVRPGAAEPRLRLADLLLHAREESVRDADQAIRWLRPFAEAPPSDEVLLGWKLLAEAHARRGDFDAAIELEQRRLEHLPDPDSAEGRDTQRRISFYKRGVPAPSG